MELNKVYKYSSEVPGHLKDFVFDLDEKMACVYGKNEDKPKKNPTSAVLQMLEKRLAEGFTTILKGNIPLLSIEQIAKKHNMPYEGELDSFEVKPRFIIEHEKIDAIGDIHGLYDELLSLIEKLGYDKQTLIHPEGRKLLFLGDYIDRGPQSVETLDFIVKAVEHGHYALMGNHEYVMWQLLTGDIDFEDRSVAVKETYLKIEQNSEFYKNFLGSLPWYYVTDTHIFVHGNIVSDNIEKMFKTTALFGFKKEDTNEEYLERYRAGENKRKLVHGHKVGKNNEAAISLERNGTFGGEIVAYRVDIDQFVSVECKVDHSERLRCKTELANVLKKIFYHKKVEIRRFGDLSLYWTSRAFKDMKEELKANGLVVDKAFNILVNPIDKPESAVISPLKEVFTIEGEGKCSMSNIIFVGENGLCVKNGKIIENQDLKAIEGFTLGYLNGKLFCARKNDLKSKPLTEEELDEVAKEYGIGRPKVSLRRFSEVNCKKGSIVRLNNNVQSYRVVL